MSPASASPSHTQSNPVMFPLGATSTYINVVNGRKMNPRAATQNESNAVCHRTGWTSHQIRIAALGPSKNRLVIMQHTRSPLRRRAVTIPPRAGPRSGEIVESWTQYRHLARIGAAAEKERSLALPPIPFMTTSYWKPPIIRGTDPGHRQATWLELFFDLIFVVVVAQLATRLAGEVSWSTAARYAIVYLPIWLSWALATFYADRFDTDDLGQRLITLGQMLAVAAMAASVAEGTAVQFAVAMALFRLLVLLSYERVRRSVPEARALATRTMGLLAVSAGLWLASAFFDGGTRIVLWLVAIGIEVVSPFLRSSRARTATVPLSLNHLPERFGLFTIIVLGETVLAVVIGVVEADWVASAALFAVVGLTISFALWWIYFESISGSALDALGSFRPIVWAMAHAPMVIAITALGVGIEHAVTEEFGHQLPKADALLLAGSLAIVLLSRGVLVAAERPQRSATHTIGNRLPAVALVLVIGLLPIAAQAVLMGLALVTGVQAAIDVRAALAREGRG